MIRCLLAAAAALLLGGCASWFGLGLPRPVQVSADDSGAEIDLDHAQQMIVRLPAAPGSGYTWVLREPLTGVVKPETSPREEDNAEVWIFTPVREGTEPVRFEHRRIAQADAVPAGVVSYTISVYSNLRDYSSK
jgi:predicted secreted protein